MRLFHNHLTVDLVAALFDFGSEPFVRLRESIWLDAFREAALVLDTGSLDPRDAAAQIPAHLNRFAA